VVQDDPSLFVWRTPERLRSLKVRWKNHQLQKTEAKKITSCATLKECMKLMIRNYINYHDA